MDESLKESFIYANKTGNTELFDALAKDFAALDKDDKDFILKSAVILSPSTRYIQHVLDCGYDLSFQSEDGETLLHFAAVSDHAETVQFFLDKGLDVNAKSDDGTVPICLAAYYTGSVDVLKTLINAGADTSVTNSGGETLLITAARNPEPAITRFFLEQGFDLEARDNDGFTPLLNAARWQTNIDVIVLLVETGADLNAKTNDGSSLAHLAARNGNAEVAEYILNSYTASEVNDSGISAFETALLLGESPDVLKLFLRRMKEEHISIACMNENPAILETLLDAGYDANSTDRHGVSVLMNVARFNTNPRRRYRCHRAERCFPACKRTSLARP